MLGSFKRWALLLGQLLAIFIGQSQTLRAAEFERAFSGSPKGDLLILRGPINAGDAAKFFDIVHNFKISKVILQSPGGLVVEALQMGRKIRELRIETSVDYWTDCASACALLWLAGTPIELRETGRVGLHASYVVEGREFVERGWSNALIGAYLSQLGYSDDFILLATSTPPTSIHWLTHADTIRASLHVIYKFGGSLMDLAIDASNRSARDVEARRMDWPTCSSASCW